MPAGYLKQGGAFIPQIGHKAFSCLLLFVMQLACQVAYSQDRWSNLLGRDRPTAGGTLNNWGSNSGVGSWFTGQASAHSWSLGVRGDSSDVGFVVSQVVPGSAASRANIQPRDVIVTVEGYQIGQVSGRLYDLTQELNRRADVNGTVQVLIQDGQTGRLASIRIQLDGDAQLLTGVIIAPQLLPADSIATIQIDNLTRPNWVVRNGQQTMSVANQQSIPFRLAYDPLYVSEQDEYQVRAVVSSGGRDILFTQPVRVLTRGNPSEVQLRLESFASNNFPSIPGGTVSAGYVNYNELHQQIVKIYRELLRRDPTSGELAASQVLGTTVSNTLERLPLKLMASQEYFDLVGRNNNDLWLQNVFVAIVGRQQNAQEAVQWRQRFADLRFSRTELIRQLKQVTL